GQRDDRTLAQRRGDALVELCRRVLGTDALPSCGGEPPQVVVTIPLEELEARAERARARMLYGPETFTAGQLRRICCDATVIPVVLGAASEILDVGRARRTVPRWLRRAVALRDRGCAHPGCDQAPAACEIHHTAEWIRDHGTTALRNLVMLCGRHHQLMHSARNAGHRWIIRMVNGRPE
ncbi:MAG: DUF222 domain-containing protein, partial [Pseudonocardiaceae bacterium]|nr:DUF222 domain-containing protein [Pseudonocardiaceae bacterium]